MAKFVTEDGMGTISGDAFMDKYYRENGNPHPICTEIFSKKHHTDVEKLKIPGGRLNCHRLNSISDYDLLCHIQQTLSLTGRCILEMITNENRECIKHNDTIAKRMHLFASKFITDKLKEKYPKHEDESDECYEERLCHIIMHQDHPKKLQMFKCEECIQRWMNSDIW